MMLIKVLANAQRLLAGDKVNGPGWTGPEHVMGYSLRRYGESGLELCSWNDEMIWQYSVAAALMNAAQGNEALFDAAWETLRAVVCPSRVSEEQFFASLPPLTPESWPKYRTWLAASSVALKQLDLREWLLQPERTLAEVLRAFDTAILKVRRPM